MDGTLNPITADDPCARLGKASVPIVRNVRHRGGFGGGDRVIVSALACEVASERHRLDDSRTGEPIVVHRARGRELIGRRSLRRTRLASPEAISHAGSLADRGAASPTGANSAPARRNRVSNTWNWVRGAHRAMPLLE